MKVQQFIKTLNNTEIGKGGTHEFYVLVSKKTKNIHKIFDSNNLKPVFLNLKNGGTIDSVHITKGGEFRINGLGEFYRNNNVSAGDEILFERRDTLNSTEFYLNLNVKTNIITFQKNKMGFDVLNIDRLQPKLINGSYNLKANYNGKICLVNIKFKESAKKRSDSPNLTDFYSITVDNKDILVDLKNNEYLQLELSPNANYLKKIIVWQQYEFQLPNDTENEETLKQRKEQIKTTIQKTIEKHGYVLGSSVKGDVRFLTKGINDIIPKTSNGDWLNKESFLFEIHYRKTEVQLKFVIAPGNEHNRAILVDILNKLPESIDALGKQWLIKYKDSLKANLFSDQYRQEEQIEKLIDQLLNDNQSQIELFEKEVLNQKDKFQY